MKRILALIIAVAAIAMIGETANAQCGYYGGYQFGAGFGAGGRNCGLELAPYFARNPPVYYSHIVKRPYGVSPYAAPAGIAPIEMGIPVEAPLSIRNPFYKMDVEPASTEVAPEAEKTENKTTWIANPYFGQTNTLAATSR